ncbi:MAG: hypothetical protein R3Y05_03875 [bacterium]
MNKNKFINIKNLNNYTNIECLISSYSFINSPNEDINNTLHIVIGNANDINKLNLLESTICITDGKIDNHSFIFVNNIEEEAAKVIQLLATNFFTAQQINIDSEDVKMLSIQKKQMFVVVSYSDNLVEATFDVVAQLKEIDLTKIENAIFNITSKENLTLSTINNCVEIIRRNTNDEISLIFGTGIDSNPLNSNIFIMLT